MRNRTASPNVSTLSIGASVSAATLRPGPVYVTGICSGTAGRPARTSTGAVPENSAKPPPRSSNCTVRVSTTARRVTSAARRICDESGSKKIVSTRTVSAGLRVTTRRIVSAVSPNAARSTPGPTTGWTARNAGPPWRGPALSNRQVASSAGSAAPSSAPQGKDLRMRRKLILEELVRNDDRQLERRELGRPLQRRQAGVRRAVGDEPNPEVGAREQRVEGRREVGPDGVGSRVRARHGLDRHRDRLGGRVVRAGRVGGQVDIETDRAGARGIAQVEGPKRPNAVHDGRAHPR